MFKLNQLHRLSKLTRSVRAGLSRWVTTLNPAGGMYYEIPRTVIPANTDFEWEFELSPSGTTFYLLGDSTSANTNNRLGLSGAKWFGFDFNNVEGANRTWFNDGKLHNVNVSRVEGVIVIKVDGIYDISNVYTGELSFDGFGRKFGGVTSTSTYTGVIFKSKLIVSNNPELNHDYRFDDNDGVLVNYAKPLISVGALGRFNNATSGTATWVHNSDGSTTMTTSGPQAYAYNGWSFPAEVGKQYLCDISSDKEARLVIYAFTQGLTDYVGVASDAESSKTSRGLTSPIPEGKNRLLVIHQVNASFGINTLTTQVPTVKLTMGYGKSVNVTPSDREIMSYSTIRNAWVGSELVINGDFSQGSTGWDWTAGWSIADSKASLAGDGGPQTLVQWGYVNTRDTYLCSFDVSTDNNNIGMQTQGGVVVLEGSTGTVTGTVKLEHTGVSFKRSPDGVVNGWLDNVSVKRIIEVAQ